MPQPNQEDLLEVLASKTDIDPNDLRNAVINLSPWFSKKEKGSFTESIDDAQTLPVIK